jgi:hypothetical protein
MVPHPCLAQTERRSFSVNPQPLDHCDTFLITEATFDVVAVKVPNGHLPDRFLYTDSFGFMKNMGRSALGLSIDVHVTKASTTQTRVKFAPTVRYKRWLPRSQSVDLLLGYVSKGQSAGLGGPMATLRYSPLTTLYLQAGACQFREIDLVPGSSPSRFREETKTRLFAGAGTGGVPGEVLWGLEAVAGLLIAAGLRSGGS